MAAPPTPERARELAVRALALREDLLALQADFRASSNESVRRVGFRLDLALGDARSINTELLETADDLVRVAAANGPGNCAVPWGVCPEHGNTLTSSGGECWCRRLDCGRRWGYDRGGLPCDEPAVWTWTPPKGDPGQICEGHAIAIREELGPDAQLEPITAAGTQSPATPRPAAG
jgi:hypothetical protein